jgi:hypothetical protein
MRTCSCLPLPAHSQRQSRMVSAVPCYCVLSWSSCTKLHGLHKCLWGEDENWQGTRTLPTMPLWQQQNPKGVIWDWTRALVTGSRRLTAWVTAWPRCWVVIPLVRELAMHRIEQPMYHRSNCLHTASRVSTICWCVTRPRGTENWE